MRQLFFALCSLFALSALSAEQVKIGALVPAGTNWGNSLKKLSKEVETATNGEVSFKVYYGGVSGDEPDVLRKIRVGQLHGGIFTGKVLGDINGDLRAMEIPFTFYNDQKKASSVFKKLTQDFNQGLKSKGFVNLGFYELGHVYVVSTKKISSLDELKGVKMWAWEGDPLIAAFLESLQLVSVPLALPDVLSSLSTGIIDAAYAPSLAILALQWHTKVKYLVDFPTAFSIGALLVSDKHWAKIKPDHQQKIMAISQKLIKEANDKSIVENEASRAQLKRAGVEFTSFPAEDYKRAAQARGKVIETIKNKVISARIIGALEKEMK